MRLSSQATKCLQTSKRSISQRVKWLNPTAARIPSTNYLLEYPLQREWFRPLVGPGTVSEACLPLNSKLPSKAEPSKNCTLPTGITELLATGQFATENKSETRVIAKCGKNCEMHCSLLREPSDARVSTASFRVTAIS